MKWAKVLAATVVIGAIAGTRMAKATDGGQGVQTPVTTPVHKYQGTRQVASIVYLDATGLPKGTLEALKDMHASTVYLYVAYHSDAYFHIPQNPYGLAEPADTLENAVNILHFKGYKVIGVISSALLDKRLRTAAGDSISQPNSDIFDPAQAGSFVLGLVQNLLSYSIDGLYIGEPYFSTISHPSQTETAAWRSLYQQVIRLDKAKHMKSDMILPDLYAAGVSVKDESGLPTGFAHLGFNGIGIDMENADSGHLASDVTRFTHAMQKVRSMQKKGTQSIVELSLRKGDLKTPISPQFFRREVGISKQTGINTIVIFANEWWSISPYRRQYKSSLEDFLKP